MADENKTICVPVKRLVKGGDVSWEILDPKPLYDGHFSTVYKGCYKGDCNHILKLAVDNVKKEVKFQKKCAENGLCVDVDDWWDCSSGDGGVIITRMLDKTIKTYLIEISQDEQIQVVKNVLEMIQKLHTLGIKHGDLHLDNVMVDKDGKLYFIDMGHSMNIKKTRYYSQSAMSDYWKFIMNIYSVSKDGSYQKTLDFVTPLAIITRLSQDLQRYNEYIQEDDLIPVLFTLLDRETFSIDTKNQHTFKGYYDRSNKRIEWSVLKNNVESKKGYLQFDLRSNCRYYRDGKLVEVKSFKGNDKDGQWAESYPNGIHKSKGKYYMDGKIGIWEEWWENGNPKSKGEYKGVEDNDKYKSNKWGIWEEWWEDGNPKSKGKYSVYETDIGDVVSGKDGTWETWSRDGKFETNTYEDGVLKR